MYDHRFFITESHLTKPDRTRLRIFFNKALVGEVYCKMHNARRYFRDTAFFYPGTANDKTASALQKIIQKAVGSKITWGYVQDIIDMSISSSFKQYIKEEGANA